MIETAALFLVISFNTSFLSCPDKHFYNCSIKNSEQLIKDFTFGPFDTMRGCLTVGEQIASRMYRVNSVKCIVGGQNEHPRP